MLVNGKLLHRRALTAALTGALAASFSGGARAATSDDATDLTGVVVTATRTAQTQDQTLAAVTVIDRADIERLQPASLMDLLRGTPGMQLANNGGPGKPTSMFLRGTASDHVLVLVDGFKLGAATNGAAAIQDIPLEQIERIEIVRGPFSSLYGSEAIGGVVQIFTRQPQGDFNPNLMLGFGSDHHAAASAGVGGKFGDGWYALEASHDNTHGINACRLGAAEAFAGCYVDQPDRDGYRNNALTLRGGYHFTPTLDGDVQFFRAEGHNEYDGSVANAADNASQVAGGKLRWQALSNLDVSLGLGETMDLAEDYLDGRPVDHFDTRRTLGTVQADLSLGEGLYSAGFDWQRDKLASSSAFAVDRRIDRGLFAQWQQRFGTQSLQASVRRDEDGQFGGKNTGSLLWGWDVVRDLRVTASYGSAFRAPSFNELYYPYYGNARLKPERSRNLEFGVRGTPDWGWWSVNVYRNVISDLIAYDTALVDATHPYGGPNNIDRARIRGAEATVGTRIAGWTVNASASWLDPRDRSHTGEDGNLLPRRARQTARLDLDRPFGAFSAGASWFVSGYRYDDAANLHRLGGYALTDLRLAWMVDRDWKLQLALNNVFDKRYETAWYYNQPGRNFMLTLRWQPAR